MLERPVSFGTDAGLAGILCTPSSGIAPGHPAFLFLNAGMLPRMGPSRLHVQLARSLAEVGFASLRFDFSGIGDSAHSRDSRSFMDRSVSEAGEAMDLVQTSFGVRSFVPFGLCSGAEVAHALALADPRVCGIVSLDGHIYPTWRFYLHRYGPGLLRARSWLNLLTGRTYVGPFLRGLFGRGRGAEEEPRSGDVLFPKGLPPRPVLERELRDLLSREVRMLQVFSGGLEDLCAYPEQYQDALRAVDFRDRLHVEFFRNADHTFTPLSEQDRLIGVVLRWALDGWGGDSLEVPGAVQGSLHEKGVPPGGWPGSIAPRRSSRRHPLTRDA